jgi:type IV secretory pathway VirB4 component
MFLIKQGHHSVVCQLDLRGFDAELKVISGRTHQVERMHEIIAGTSNDPGDWLPRFLREHGVLPSPSQGPGEESTCA